MHLKEIKLHTSRIDELQSFYEEILQLTVSRLHPQKLEILVGQSKLIFEQSIDSSQPFYHFAFNIPSNKIDEAFEWLKKRVELLWLDDYDSYIADFKSWHAKSVYFLDPGGNIGELIARFDLDDVTQEVFSDKQFRNISEIGLVFPDKTFDDDIIKLLNNFQLSYFPKQSPMEHFRAIGSDEGLFIAVSTNRNWFSTKMPSGIFPMEVQFENNSKNYTLKL